MLERERLRRSPPIVRRYDATPAATYSSPRLLESSLFFVGARKAQKYASLCDPTRSRHPSACADRSVFPDDWGARARGSTNVC